MMIIETFTFSHVICRKYKQH